MSEGALGMGLDALIRSPKKEKNTKKDEKDSKTIKEKKVIKKSEKKDKNNKLFQLNEEKLDEIKEQVKKNPRISLWSTKSAACLKYLKKTTPEFSISNEASLLLDEAIKNKYPEVWELFEEL